jgi:hypothetical protein
MANVNVRPSPSIWTNLLLQPPAHRAILRNLLRRALAAHGPDRFLVTILVNPTP